MEVERILLDLAVMFVAAKLAGAVFERFRQPAVIGELVVGIALGAHALGLVQHREAHEVFQELGAIILLFAVGLDTPLSDLKAVGGRSIGVGVAGIVLPFITGFLLIQAIGGTTNEALFLGTAMVATSVGVTARVLADLGRIKDPESRVILGAAVVDDILGLLVLAVVAGAATGGVTVVSIVSLGVVAIVFVVLIGGLGPRVVGLLRPGLDRLGELGVFTVALGICLLLAAAAGALQLAAIIGAFLAGMAFAETRDRYRLEHHLSPVYSFLVPFFFVITGTLVDLSVFADASTAAVTGAVLVLAIAGKFIGCGGAALGMGRRSAAIIGTGMVPRAEVGILVASIGLARGVIGDELYAVVVAMSVLTTLVVPPVLTALFRPSTATARRDRDRGREIEGVGG